MCVIYQKYLSEQPVFSNYQQHNLECLSQRLWYSILYKYAQYRRTCQDVSVLSIKENRKNRTEFPCVWNLEGKPSKLSLLTMKSFKAWESYVIKEAHHPSWFLWLWFLTCFSYVLGVYVQIHKCPSSAKQLPGDAGVNCIFSEIFILLSIFHLCIFVLNCSDT